MNVCMWSKDYVVMFAGDEAKRNEVVVKDMRASSQTVLSEESLVSFISKNKQSV